MSATHTNERHTKAAVALLLVGRTVRHHDSVSRLQRQHRRSVQHEVGRTILTQIGFVPNSLFAVQLILIVLKISQVVDWSWPTTLCISLIIGLSAGITIVYLIGYVVCLVIQLVMKRIQPIDRNILLTQSRPLP